MANTTEKLVEVLMAPVQRLENALIQVRDGFDVRTAVGAQLDVLGKKVGQARGGLDDATYRRYIQARIATNRSTGKREELIRIARLVLGHDDGTVAVHAYPPASVVVRIDGVAEDATVEAALITFLRQAVGLGIKIFAETTPVAPAGAFAFAGGDGLGFDNTASPGTGGQLSDIRD